MTSLAPPIAPIKPYSASEPVSNVVGSRTTFVMLTLILVGWLIRLTVFEHRQLGEDGLSSVGIARLDVDQLLAFTLRDIHPPLSYWLLGRWLDLIGPSFIVARWPSLAADALLVSLLFRTVAWRLGTAAALASAALWVTVPAGFLAGATVRDFIVGALVTTLSWTLLLWRTNSRVRPPALALVTSLALLTWYFHPGAWLLQIAVARRVRGTLSALLAGAALAAPWYLAVAASWLPRWGTERLGVVGPVAVESPVVTYLIGAGRTLIGDVPGGGVVGCLIWLLLVGNGIVRLSRTGHRAEAAVLGAGIVLGLGATIGIAAAWGGPDFVPRYFLLAVLAATPVIAFGLAHGPRLAIGTILLVALPGLVTFADFVSIRLVDRPRSVVAEALIQQTDTEDLLLFDNFELESYVWLSHPARLTTRSLHTYGVSYWYDRDIERPLILAATTGGTVRWIVHDRNEDRHARAFEAELAARHSPVGASALEGLTIREFRGPASWQPSTALFGGSVRLTGAMVPATVAACRLAPVTLRWRALRPTAEDLTVFVHLIGGDGRRVGQDDGAPSLGTGHTFDPTRTDPVTDIHWIGIAAGTPPGRYRVAVGLYDDNAHLALPDGTEQITVGQFTLEGSCR